MIWTTAKDFRLSEADKKLLEPVPADPSGRRFLLTHRSCVLPRPPSSPPDYRPPIDLDGLPPNLYMRFQDMTITEEAILAFAERYDSLGGDTQSFVRSPNVSESAESFDVWEDEIGRMREVVSMLEKLEDGGFGLEEHFRWADGGYFSSDRYGTISFPRPDPESSPHRNTSLLIYLANGRVKRIIESHLHNRVRVGYPPGHGFKLEPKATGLIGALWLQLAQDIERKAHFKKCVICKKPVVSNHRDTDMCVGKEGAKCRKEKNRRDKRQDHLLRLVKETPGASWEARLELWESWRKDDPELLKIRTADALEKVYETAKTEPGYALKF